ncbi:MAG: PD-(D/E)XK nuclease family protein, partial [Acidobacteriaceae bacterium]|nr:PD-(D/E)XK nuclease family protein [Acidobacteriaceae bacterium]
MRIACPSLSSWSEKGAVIVTPSRLLASVATQQFTRERLDQRLETWERPAVYHVDAWLSRLWHEARYRSPEVATLLSPDQERVLWQEIIEQKHSKLFDAAGTARLASEAARLLADWQIPLEADAWGNQEDARHFQYWYKLFRRRCREEKWITRADLLRLVPNWIATGFCSRELMILAGFLSFSPAIERVKQTLGLFAVVETVPEPAVTRPGLGVRCHEFADEIEQAARWSRALFEANHAVSIGIFVPELPAQSRLVERCFDAVFYPSAAVRMSASGFDGNSGMYQRGSVFHIAASRPLSEHPLVSSALLLLELGHSRIAIADAGAILRCPFIIGAESERSARALADIELRKRRDLDVSLADMEFSARECVLLKPVWRRLRSLLSKTPEHLDLPGWSERFQNLLGAIGWPGDRQLTDDEQEVTEKWSEALSRLASLGLVSRTASYSTAVAHLQRILATRGSERGDWLSPIQILDSSNSVGLEFDRAWLAGLSNETWPPQSAPHPLVPLTLQRASHVPGSSFGHVRLERERATKSLFCVAPTVVASYSEQLSAIVEPLIVRDGQLLQWTGKLPRDSYPTINLLETEDSAAPRYRATEPARGGTSIVKAQSQCPFRAFAEFRLNAQRPEDACFGFDARDRGGFLHKALQHVWRQLGSQDCLRSTDADDLRDIIRNAVALAVKEDASSPFHELITI